MRVIAKMAKSEEILGFVGIPLPLHPLAPGTFDQRACPIAPWGEGTGHAALSQVKARPGAASNCFRAPSALRLLSHWG